MNLTFDLEPLDFITGLNSVLNTTAIEENPAESIGELLHLLTQFKVNRLQSRIKKKNCVKSTCILTNFNRFLVGIQTAVK